MSHVLRSRVAQSIVRSVLSQDPVEFQSQAIDVGRTLSDAWGVYWAKGQELASDHLPQNHVAVIAGLAAHVNGLATAGFDLFERGDWLVAMPIVRSAYECAIRAQWINQVPDAGDGFLAEDSRQMGNYERTLSEAQSETMRDAASRISHRIVSDYGDATSEARRFDLACRDLEPAGVDAYAIYRALSQYVHPSVLLVDQYLRDREGSVEVLASARRGGGSVWAGILASSLVWATSVVEFHARDREFKRATRAAAGQLSIEPILKMSDAGWLRNNRSRR